jgi:hypothetical protein
LGWFYSKLVQRKATGKDGASIGLSWVRHKKAQLWVHGIPIKALLRRFGVVKPSSALLSVGATVRPSAVGRPPCVK